ncbi:uncharacterized protein LOC118192830 [Stegodyphus dumicola]|uniref:uncharacterized protein LOC118192830 n=1 Tax=Stegodyphus dumicola TaxID=202533 RepID=UPI0015B287E4|nr:uncharacterized protein LOC118192830 [Stegodyphus dumicola]
MQVEEKLVPIKIRYKSEHVGIDETLIKKSRGYNCTSRNIWTRQCQTVNIEIAFDDFQITNITYNPKFESLELLSVLGGYMGMYLGVSIVAVYDFAEMIASAVNAILKKRRVEKKRKKLPISKVIHSRISELKI